MKKAGEMDLLQYDELVQSQKEFDDDIPETMDALGSKITA